MIEISDLIIRAGETLKPAADFLELHKCGAVLGFALIGAIGGFYDMYKSKGKKEEKEEVVKYQLNKKGGVESITRYQL